MPRSFLFPLVLAASFSAAPSAFATAKSTQKIHRVAAGQHLIAIAKRYGVSVEALRKANAIDEKGTIRAGQTLVIPASTRSDEPSRVRPAALSAKPETDKPALSRSTPLQAPSKEARPLEDTDGHRVARGDTLSHLAIRYRTTVDELRTLNRLGKSDSLRVGQLLVLPPRSTEPNDSRGGAWQRYAKPAKQKGHLTILTHTAKFSGLAVDARGRLQKDAVRALNALFGAGGSHPALPERLIRLLVTVSDTFGGRPIRVVSGYRTSSYYQDSRHKHSSAVDFALVGVPNAVVCEYLRGFQNVGVGFYPNSTFVHLDVRGQSAYWVDYSGPGEAPRLSPRAPAAPPPRPEHRRLLAELDTLFSKATAGLERSSESARGASRAATRARTAEQRNE